MVKDVFARCTFGGRKKQVSCLVCFDRFCYCPIWPLDVSQDRIEIERKKAVRSLRERNGHTTNQHNKQTQQHTHPSRPSFPLSLSLFVPPPLFFFFFFLCKNQRGRGGERKRKKERKGREGGREICRCVCRCNI